MILAFFNCTFFRFYHTVTCTFFWPELDAPLDRIAINKTTPGWSHIFFCPLQYYSILQKKYHVVKGFSIVIWIVVVCYTIPTVHYGTFWIKKVKKIMMSISGFMKNLLTNNFHDISNCNLLNGIVESLKNHQSLA